MTLLLNNPAVQFLIVVLVVCAIAIGSCMCIEKMVVVLWPVTDLELGELTARTNVASPAVTIFVDPATSDEEAIGNGREETPIMN